MTWRIYLQSGIAAAAMPVVGFVSGKVVGEAATLKENPFAPALAVTGLIVYAIALAASYAHLRHYYSRFDAEGVRASPFIAFAVELATFYLSFASVALESRWALFGSLIGAGVVFWGNVTSMSFGLSQKVQERVQVLHLSQRKEKEEPETEDEVPFPTEGAVHIPEEEFLVHTWTEGKRVLNGTPKGSKKASDLFEPSFPLEGTAPLDRGDEEEGEDEDGENDRAKVLLEVLTGPKGLSVLARELGWSKSSVHRALKRLENAGLVRKRDGLYERV